MSRRAPAVVCHYHFILSGRERQAVLRKMVPFFSQNYFYTGCIQEEAPEGVSLCPGDTGKKEETPKGVPLCPGDMGKEGGNVNDISR